MPTPLPLAVVGAALFAGGAALRPLAALGGVVATLPFYLFGRQLGGQAVSPTEATLVLTALGIGARAAVGATVARLGWAGVARAPRPPRGAGPIAAPAPNRAADANAPHAPAADPWRGFDAPLALFLAAALLSLLATEYLRLSLRELRTLIVEPVLFFLLLRAVVRTPDDARRLVDVLLAAATVVAVFALAQLVFGGAVTEVQGVRRVHGTYTSPNHLALLLGRAIPFALALAWLLPRGRAMRVAAALICGAALLATFSLGGWLGTAVGVLVVVGLLGGRRPLLLLAVAALVVGAVVLAAAPVERLAGRLDPTRGTTLVRVQLWQASITLIRESPLLGIGLDNFLYRYAAHVPPGAQMEPNLSHPHNLVLQAWLQLGIVGLAALGWLLVRFVRTARPSARATTPPVARALAAGALGSMADFAAHGAIDNGYFLVDMACAFWLTVAAACAAALAAPRRADRAGARPASTAHTSVQSPSAAPT